MTKDLARLPHWCPLAGSCLRLSVPIIEIGLFDVNSARQGGTRIAFAEMDFDHALLI